jgi:hypothetical protein
MAKAFKTAAAFRTSLEERLKQVAADSGLPLMSLRLKVVIERLLARLFASQRAPWLLKGGYAMELRYRPKARTTKDIDLAVPSADGELAARLARIRDEMQTAADNDLNDYFVFQIGSQSAELQGAPEGGARFPVNALLAGRTFARFHIDVGFGDSALSGPEELIGQDFLAFASIPPAKALAIPKAQQFAEKLHAYTLLRIDRPNTRVKDLVDLVLFITSDPPSADALAPAIRATFDARKTHLIPDELPLPPASWAPIFAELASEAGLSPDAVDDAFQILAAFYNDLRSVALRP